MNTFRSPRALYLALLLVFSCSLQHASAQNVLTATVDGNRVTFRGPTTVRYYADYGARTVRLPGATLADATTFPFTVLEGEDGLTLKLTTPFRLALSADEKTLTLVQGETLGATPHPIAEDERAPVMYPLANAEPGAAAALLKSLYEGLQVEVDARQRALLVMVNPDDRGLVDALVATLDAPRPQVMFEAEILEINQDITKSLGINYDSIFTFSLAEGEGGSILSPGRFGRSPMTLSFGLNMLKVNGAADVLAQPRVTTLDGVEAQINATQTVPVIVPGASNTQTVQNITTGITLRMLPKVSPDGTVEAELAITVSTPTGTTSQGIPQFSSREASTTVRVANGEPIAIGGLLEKRTIKGTSKVPILGDIPLLGALFRSTRTEKRETDLVIMVTPRIVDMPGLPVLVPSGGE